MNNSFKDKIFNITSSKEFADLCLQLFSFQYKNNPIYFQYANNILKRKTPQCISDIPFLPIEFFKTHSVICDGLMVEKKFHSSGTTNKKSTHLIPGLNIYEKSFMTTFKMNYGEPSKYTILAFLPSYLESKDSSLVYMVDKLIKNSNTKNSRFYKNNIQQLYKDLKKLEEKEEKILLIGVSYALLDLAENFPMNLNHTTIIETGGMKGRRKELTKEEMHNILKNAFGLKNIHSEYGMTEILSQAYSQGDGVFKSPPWMKVVIRDPLDPLTIIGDNRQGGVNIIDLANMYSCPFIATQDLGKSFGKNNFSILGRFDNSDIRGCNLLI